jgi:hypothetical protein
MLSATGRRALVIHGAHARGACACREPVADASNDTAASSHFLDCPEVVGLQRNERNFMMNHANGWMNGWTGGVMWFWPVIGILVVVLLVVVIIKLSNNK